MMDKNSRNSIIGFGLIGLGCGLAAVGLSMVVPACANWSANVLGETMRKGREGLLSGIESAAATMGEVASRAQHHFGEAAKAARPAVAKAAGAVEDAAHRVRQRASYEQAS